MSDKILLLSAKEDCYDGYYSGDAEVIVKEMEIDDLIKYILNTYHSQLTTAILADQHMLNVLDQAGLRNVKTIKDKVEKLVAGTRYFIFQDGKNSTYANSKEVSLDNLGVYDADILAADGSELLQTIDKKSI